MTIPTVRIKGTGDINADAYDLIAALVVLGCLIPNSDFALDDLRTLLENHKRYASYRALNSVDLYNFLELLNNFTIVPGSVYFCLGDEVSDRGLCCAYIFAIFKYLKENGLDFRIIYSNHADMFMGYLETLVKNPNSFKYFPYKDCISNSTTKSFKRLVHSILEEQTQATSDYKDLLKFYVTEIYQNHLDLLQYSEDEDGRLRIYSHAPLCGTIILDAYKVINPQKTVAEYAKVLTNKAAFINAIDEINVWFHQNTHNWIAYIYPNATYPPIERRSIHELFKQHLPLFAIIWRRLSIDDMNLYEFSSLEQDVYLKYYKDTLFPSFVSKNIHGHDQPDYERQKAIEFHTKSSSSVITGYPPLLGINNFSDQHECLDSIPFLLGPMYTLGHTRTLDGAALLTAEKAKDIEPEMRTDDDEHEPLLPKDIVVAETLNYSPGSPTKLLVPINSDPQTPNEFPFVDKTPKPPVSISNAAEHYGFCSEAQNEDDYNKDHSHDLNFLWIFRQAVSCVANYATDQPSAATGPMAVVSEATL